ncbi:MAG: hypothetical protein JXC32_05130 [Anaerolineae bacterium]|nr:hypothetical protein [Anaerolineae bacterium]
MILICERDAQTLERICEICDIAPGYTESAREMMPMGIDERNLAWFYVAPGYENETTSRQLLAFARDLIGPNAWAVVQASDAAGRRLCSELGLKIVASYANQAEEPSGISVHVVTTGATL